ncbi:MAG TPA: phosphodiester glycosidase family protein [Gemmatimonadales bacterium]|nr:phosphodiester glycosidase family protein [Gemmatimonadales bacterium]
MPRLLPLLLLLALAAPSTPPSLSVHSNGHWHTWWRAEDAPAQWDAALPLVTQAVQWEDSAGGIALGSLRLAASGEAWRTRAIIVRVDPSRIRFTLARSGTRLGAPFTWTIDSAPPSAMLALNAGEFDDDGAWGWLVRDGHELQPPGSGPLAPAVMIDTVGNLSIVPPDSIATLRGAKSVMTAFQSYPALLQGDGSVPPALLRDTPYLDRTHRDARLAIGLLRDGQILIVLTRFDALGGVLDGLPFGLTTPEMAALLGALGARRAVSLDGGVSGQLLVRLHGQEYRWTGWRKVPVGMVGQLDSGTDGQMDSWTDGQ